VLHDQNNGASGILAEIAEKNDPENCPYRRQSWWYMLCFQAVVPTE
jgi:hypothetical protein